MPTLEQIYVFLERHCRVRASELSPNVDLERDLRITGDDFFELMAQFANEFSVDLRDYRWYFHHSEEVSFNPGALLFKPPHRQVRHIPVTPSVLLAAAKDGRWPVCYPEHKLARRRYDVLITYGFFAALGVAVAVVSLCSRAGH